MAGYRVSFAFTFSLQRTFQNRSYNGIEHISLTLTGFETATQRDNQVTISEFRDFCAF
jgi:hypothetical protein